MSKEELKEIIDSYGDVSGSYFVKFLQSLVDLCNQVEEDIDCLCFLQANVDLLRLKNTIRSEIRDYNLVKYGRDEVISSK